MNDDPPENAKPKRGRPFPKGTSGNPRGRPKGSKSLPKLIARELDGRVQLTEQGRRRVVSRREALSKRIVNDALAGKAKSIELVLGMDREAAQTLQEVAGALTGTHDEATKASLIRRLREAISPDDEEERSEPER